MDKLLDILANTHRRRLLVALLEHNPQDDADTPILDDVQFADEDLKAFKVQMQHTHLPKLAEAEFIEWDQETNTVRKGSRFEAIRPLLELMQNHADELPDDWL